MQQWIGWALIVVQAGLMSLLARTVFFPVLVVLLALLGVVTKWRIPLSREKAFILSAAAAFFFLLKHRFAPHEFPMGTEFIRTQVAFIFAQYLLFMEAALFVFRRREDRLSPVLPALGAVALICIADIQISNEQRPITRLFAVTYPLLWSLYSWSSRKPLRLPDADETQQLLRHQARKRRRLSAGLVLGVVAGVAWVACLGLYEFEKKIEGWMVQLMSGASPGSQIGFSRSSRLGSVAHKKSEAEKQIALWAYTQEFPGYLRGAVFSRLESNEWLLRPDVHLRQLTKSEHPPPGIRNLAADESLYTHPQSNIEATTDWGYVECWLANDNEATAFVPLGTTHLIAATDRVDVLPFGVFLLTDPETRNPYTTCVPLGTHTEPISQAYLENWLHVPTEYQQDLEELAKSLFADAPIPQEKIRAVEAYFHNQYQYELGIEIPANENPLLYFLREKPAAHCEYFASAAALLLRVGQVPTRYVTGFVPSESNPAGEYWLARNRDAHAWVEAYVEGEGWVIVEATPSQGVPASEPSETHWGWWEALKEDWRRFRAFLSQSRWNRLRGLLKSSWLSLPLGLFLIAFLTYLAIRIPWPWPKAKPKPEATDPNLIEMHRLLEDMDNQLIPFGLRRMAGETLHQFARRVQDAQNWPMSPPDLIPDELESWANAVAGWYADYANDLYRGRWDAETLRDLQSRVTRPVSSHR